MDDMFNWCWDRYALDGLVDDRPGAEYRRIFALWVANGRPGRAGGNMNDVAVFITSNANVIPEGPGDTNERDQGEEE